MTVVVIPWLDHEERADRLAERAESDSMAESMLDDIEAFSLSPEARETNLNTSTLRSILQRVALQVSMAVLMTFAVPLSSAPYAAGRRIQHYLTACPRLPSTVWHHHLIMSFTIEYDVFSRLMILRQTLCSVLRRVLESTLDSLLEGSFFQGCFLYSMACWRLFRHSWHRLSILEFQASFPPPFERFYWNWWVNSLLLKSMQIRQIHLDSYYIFIFRIFEIISNSQY